MVRRSTIGLSGANVGKLKTLGVVMDEMTVVVNRFIDILWARGDFETKFIDVKVGTWLSSRMQQCLGKQALEIVKSQRKRKKKTKPVFRGNSFSLDSRFVDIRYDQNSFDIWVRLSSIGNKVQLKLPARKHMHFNKFSDWTQKGTIQLRRNIHKEYLIDVLFEKATPEVKKTGKTIGVDVGYKKLLVSSDGGVYDFGLESCYENISRKRQGSKAFKRALKERDNLINRSINSIDLTTVKEVVCEDLKNVKKGTKKNRTLRKSFVNKLQRWSYSKVLSRLSMLTDESGVLLTRVNPSYTSQKCSLCGVICKSNRCGETYRCACGLSIDADLNAAINISHMGVYSPHAQ